MPFDHLVEQKKYYPVQQCRPKCNVSSSTADCVTCYLKSELFALQGGLSRLREGVAAADSYSASSFRCLPTLVLPGILMLSSTEQICDTHYTVLWSTGSTNPCAVCSPVQPVNSAVELNTSHLKASLSFAVME